MWLRVGRWAPSSIELWLAPNHTLTFSRHLCRFICRRQQLKACDPSGYLRRHPDCHVTNPALPARIYILLPSLSLLVVDINDACNHPFACGLPGCSQLPDNLHLASRCCEGSKRLCSQPEHPVGCSAGKSTTFSSKLRFEHGADTILM